MKRIMQALPHLSIVLAGLWLVLFVANYFNGSMGFLDSDFATTVMVLVSVMAIVNACALVIERRRAERSS